MPEAFGGSVMTYDRVLSHVHPDDRATVHRVVDQASRNHQPFEFSFRSLHRDGMTLLIVTHEIRVSRAATRVLLLRNGALETRENFGPPHEFDTLHASYSAAYNGGVSTAQRSPHSRSTCSTAPSSRPAAVRW